MTQEDYRHPIAPPPELVEQWFEEANTEETMAEVKEAFATRAAQWGADQELEACCEWLKLEGHEHEHEALFAARRPKPPSLKEQALKGLTRLVSTGEFFSDQMKDLDTIRRALEQLDD